MSVFTNPASSAAEHATAYVAAVLDLLGSKNALQVLRETPEIVQRYLRESSEAELRRPEAPGKWSVAEVVQHLSDSELVFGFRVRMVLAHDRPPLVGYDQDLWASRLRYRDSDHDEAMALFTALRLANVRLLAGASPAEMLRAGVHAERGEQTLEEMVRLYAGHDLVHLQQIERIRRSWGDATPS